MRAVIYKLNSSVPGPFPLPIFGNMYGFIRHGISQYHMESFKKYGKTFQSFGIGLLPEIVTSDPELIKAITIKEFKLFQNRRVISLIKH